MLEKLFAHLHLTGSKREVWWVHVEIAISAPGEHAGLEPSFVSLLKLLRDKAQSLNGCAH